MGESSWIGFGGLLLAFLTLAFTLFRHSAAQRSSLETKIEAAREIARAYTDQKAETESKGRHDLSNRMQSALGEVKSTLQGSMSELRTDMRNLERDVVRKPDMQATEARILTSFAELKTESKTSLGKLEEKLDRLLAPQRRPAPE